MRASVPSRCIPEVHNVKIHLKSSVNGATEHLDHPVLYPHQFAPTLQNDFSDRFPAVSGVGRCEEFWAEQRDLGNPKLTGHPMLTRHRRHKVKPSGGVP